MKSLSSFVPLALATCLASIPAAAFDLEATKSTQAIVVVTDDWRSASAMGVFIEKTDGMWKKGLATPMVVGRNGLGWGRGLHPAPAKSEAPIKREGDGKAPAGVFALGATAYGRGLTPPMATALKWTPAASNVCVDDVKSPQYNRIFSSTNKKGPYRSAEKMRRKDALYDVVMVVDHNGGAGTETSVAGVDGSTDRSVERPIPGKGSCIFLHVWRRAKKGTAGCTAMPKKNMVRLLGLVDPSTRPLLIQLPRSEYERLAPKWKLPSLNSIGL